MKPFQNIKVTCTVEITESEDRPPVTYITEEVITGPVFDPTYTGNRLARTHAPTDRALGFLLSYLSLE